MSEITKTKPNATLLASMGLFGGTGQAIEEQERAGGREMLQATHTLPVDGSDDPKLAELGIVFGEVLEDDPIFREATLPEGWTRRDGEHPYGYWTYLDDENGVQRVAIFYKAAFYDRRATIYAREEAR